MDEGGGGGRDGGGRRSLEELNGRGWMKVFLISSQESSFSRQDLLLNLKHGEQLASIIHNCNHGQACD